MRLRPLIIETAINKNDSLPESLNIFSPAVIWNQLGRRKSEFFSTKNLKSKIVFLFIQKTKKDVFQEI